MNIRTERVEGAVRTIRGGELVLSAEQWTRFKDEHGVPGGASGRAIPRMRHIADLEDGLVHVEIVVPTDFRVGDVIRFPA